MTAGTCVASICGKRLLLLVAMYDPKPMAHSCHATREGY